MRRKAKMILIICIVAVVVLIVGGLCYLNYKMSSLMKMTSFECIEFSTKNTDDVFLTVGIIHDGKQSFVVYGRDGKIIEPKEYMYEIGSVTKTFTCSVLAKAISENKLSLDNHISDFFPDLDKQTYTPTIKRLATHTSGYGDINHSPIIKNYLKGKNPFYGFNKQGLLDVAQSKNLKDKDYKWVYSNFGMSCIGQILDSVYPEFDGFDKLMDNYMLNELDMQNSKTVFDLTSDLYKQQPTSFKYWQWKETDAYLPAGSIVSTISDMLKYALIQLDVEHNRITQNGKDLSYLKNAHSIHASIEPQHQLEVNVDAMGLGWVHDFANDLIWHNGGTTDFNSYLGFDIKNDNAVIVLMNTKPGYRIPATMIGPKILRELNKSVD